MNQIAVVQRQSTSKRSILPLWLLVIGNAVMMVSLWLLSAGGMVSKIVLLVFWASVLIGYGRSFRLSATVVLGALILLAFLGLIGIGKGDGLEKLRLIGNVLMLPVGILVGVLIGRDAVRVMVPALVLYLLATSSFYPTHEGARLNQPFLFLGLFALASVCEPRWRGVWAVISGIAVLLSQTRIAVLAMILNLLGLLRLSRAITWVVGLAVIGVVGWLAVEHLPRLLLTHDSGRLVFWREFADIWLAAPTSRQWLGFGAGSVEVILSGYASFTSFGALHNDHFRILFETGIGGALMWTVGWIVMLWYARMNRLAICILLSVMVTMVTDNTLNYGHYLICVGIAAGVAIGQGGYHEPA